MQIVSFDMWITQFQIFVYILLLSVKILGFVYSVSVQGVC